MGSVRKTMHPGFAKCLHTALCFALGLIGGALIGRASVPASVNIAHCGGSAYVPGSDCVYRNTTIMEAYGAIAKWTPLPAAERVNGLLIEELLPELQFRPGYAYGQTDDVEDLTHLLPWLLGNQVNLNNASRRVFMDLGAHTFNTSTKWFMRMYPVDFDEIYAFEVVHDRFKPPYNSINRLPHPPKVMLYEKKVGIHDMAETDLGVPGINILEFIRELEIKKDDTLIVKMDIEGSEWHVLPTLLKTPEVLEVIDELFVEVHYGDWTMSNCGWNAYNVVTLDQAIALMQKMRSAGVRTHYWP